MTKIKAKDLEIDCGGILLDFDGTLVDSESTLLRLWADVVRLEGIEKSMGDLSSIVRGRPATKIVSDLIPAVDADRTKAILHALEVREEAGPYALMPGAVDFVANAKKSGLLVGIVTSSWTKKVLNVLNSHGITNLFDLIVTREDVSNLKPSPEPYVLAIKKSKLESHQLIAVEDSDSGVISAIRAGLPCIGFQYLGKMSNDIVCTVDKFDQLKVLSS